MRAARIVEQIKPVYTPDLQQEGVEGTVKIEAVISRDGVLSGLNVKSSPDPRLTQIALDSLHQWRYQPVLLNGQPVEVLTTIDLNFQLSN